MKNSQRIIWTITGGAVALALVLLAVRMTQAVFESAAARRTAAEERDGRIQIMVALLERDPRVRRPPTQRAVEAVARFTENAGHASAEAFYALGLRLYYGERDYMGAEEAFRKAVELQPEWSWSHNLLAILLFDIGREDEAHEAWQQAMRLSPEWSRPHSDMAIMYRKADRMDAAVIEVLEALELNPEGPVTHYNYGVILDVLGNHKEARTRYEKVLELDPSLPAPHYNLACSYAREGDLTKALPYLERAISLDEAFRKDAAKDPDFDPVREEEAFVRFMHSD